MPPRWGHRELDVVVFALSRARLGGQQPAAVDLLEVAVRELVAALPLRVLLVIHPEVLPGVLADPCSSMNAFSRCVEGRCSLHASRSSNVHDPEMIRCGHGRTPSLFSVTVMIRPFPA
jgi:hypothetical protein